MLAAAVQAAKRRRLADQATGSPLDASGCPPDACGESGSDGESCADGAGGESCSESGSGQGSGSDDGRGQTTYMMQKFLGTVPVGTTTCEYPSAKWWSRPMLDAVASRWDRLRPRLLRGMQISEGCAGMALASIAARSLGIPLLHTGTASESKAAARTFMLDNCPDLRHIFGSLADQAAATSEPTYCHRHGILCSSCPSTERDDLFVCGPPCQPYSQQRADHSTKGCSSHRDVDISMDCQDDTVMQVVKERRPRAVLLENVLGFTRPDPVTNQVPVMAFLKMLEQVRREDNPDEPYYEAVHIFELCPRIWANLSRPRTLAFLHSR